MVRRKRSLNFDSDLIFLRWHPQAAVLLKTKVTHTSWLSKLLVYCWGFTRWLLGHHCNVAIDGIDKWLAVFLSDCSVLVWWLIDSLLACCSCVPRWWWVLPRSFWMCSSQGVMLLIDSFACFGGVHHSVTCPIWDYVIFRVLFEGKLTLRMLDTSVR